MIPPTMTEMARAWLATWADYYSAGDPKLESLATLLAQVEADTLERAAREAENRMLVSDGMCEEIAKAIRSLSSTTEDAP